MHNMILLVVGLLTVASVGRAQISQPGQCATINLMQNFVLNSFATGTWYELGKGSTQNADCSSLQFTANAGGTISVSNPSVVNNFLETATGTATHTTGTAQLTLTLSNSNNPIDFWILGSDYTNYAIAINCVNSSPTQRTINVWQLGRAVNSYNTPATLNAANTALSAVGLNVADLTSIDHSTAACTQLPVIGNGQPVILDGQCATASIPVVQNFDVQAFTGTWHEISSYYSANAVGTCARANYDLVGSTVNVVNSQVLNQRLDTISGTATLIGTDQSGRLSVTLNVQGVSINQELLILDTDYTGYAVSYSCFNLPNNQRQVTSWILSRSKQISAASQTEVNRVITTLVDLNNAYYIPTDQSDTGCFYFPTHQPGVAVDFPGQCENNIAAFPSFNLNQFVGTWHEVEAYPKVPQTGTCVNHAFTSGANNNILNLESNQVVNQAATTASGSVTLASTDGSGRLTLTMTTGGQTISFPYWVLATDYTSYALVYSCENLNNDYRRVHSWKLSRTQTLPTAAAALIDTAMAAVQVLDQQYFENIDQTDAGCFYFPEAQANTPVIFPGPCDTSIPVQANFNPEAYMGLWHDIESYPSTFQYGTCNTAFYTLTGGVVDVFNTQVINQRLDTINGIAVIPDPTQPAKLLVTFPVAGTNETISTEYWVLSTDYTSYSLVYTCANLPDNQRALFSWKLSRTKQMPQAAITAINAVTENILVLDSRYYFPQDHTATGCFHFPEPQTGVPVDFPGSCDNTIAAMPNFNLASFIGTWHEVEAYPKVPQTGTCVNHAFTSGANNNILNLESNQVVNQAATTASGSVTLASTDGSGRLTLTMTTGGQTISFPYWVLDTDYTSYALVYSCENLNNDYRRVHSWKLSRTQTLPTAAAALIDTAMEAVQVLEQQYFENIDQTNAGCFYFPEAQANTPVIFPGPCETSIPVQANFNPAAYMGLWHDIESYPSTFQFGTCNNAYYTLTGGVVDVFNTQVIDQQLDTINGTAIIPDPTQPAKLLVTFPVAGTDETISTEYWVLSTDYTSYSLVYTCANLPNNQRALFSWKLSRTKQMPQAAITAINAVTDNIQVLDSRYYFPQDQTANGCFHFPEPQTGVPVVFPGPCDNTIAAMPNFNLTSFVGTWHEVEAYPKVQQTGTCVNHAFTPGTTNNFLNLVSNQVVNEMVTSASGSVTLASTDGSGRLTLTMTTSGQTISIPYWVLDTDYTSYALIYSCENLNNDYRQVHSWKLSRTQTLPVAAVTPINTAIEAVQVLEQRYFEDVDQSPTGCFSYPAISPGDPIILEGQCGTVTPISNFQSNAFAGTWHEISRFASARQSGNCAASQFTSAGQNSFTLTQTIVYNERQVVVSGTATFANDGSGTLTATLSDGASLTYTTTIYILDTEYTDFALLYSCENIQGTNSRQIYSWKMSRSQSGLSQAANDRISQVVSSNPDLHEAYYQTTSQTSNDCFYYPVIEGTPEAIILPGSCPAVSAVANFNPTNYLGYWYDVARYPVASQFGTCPIAEYSLVDGVITIHNTMVVNETLRVQEGIARLSVTGTGLLQVTVVLENGEESVAQYQILSTDYTSYSLLYSCSNLADGTRRVLTWKFSRTPTLTAAANAAINGVINSIQGLNEDYYVSQSHTNQDCFYVPEPVPGESVMFRGGCEQVTGMQGFVASQYLGWWHEIERYPSDGVYGHCTSAHFEQNSANAIQVIESEVYNGVANETTNVAVISADGTITITRNGVATTYVVIDTDYNTYSLLYSCEDISGLLGPHRRVWSAKHSKVRSLSAAAQAAMAPLIEANPVLNQRLYESVDQTDSACFHYREDPGEQVTLPGQCDDSIPVQANFDVSQFAGTWYQLERYPYPQVSNDGTCVGTRYTVNGESVTVLNWEVLGGVLNTKEGSASVNGAILTVTLPVDGSDETVTRALHILSTDYEDYALAYTCENINDFQRTVGAFKLSRSRSLSNNGQYAIGTYMTNREELHQPYFISISHNDDCEEPSSAFLFKSSIIVMLICVVLQLVM